MEHKNMEEGVNELDQHGDVKKLSFVVVFLSLFVVVLFGFAPLS